MSAMRATSTGSWQWERRWLGYAGLVPFLACLAVLLLTGDRHWNGIAVDTLRNYAAVIASFLGALHWALAGASPDRLQRARLRWGVVPALVGWALLALPAASSLAGFALLFAAILLVDRRLLPILDDGYRRLRLQLSVVVVPTLVAAAALAAVRPA
ncbi:MAG: DUF3429 domain-containing protein [Chromatiaceae bacterium]|jgi:hypothetical protein|nr:DUF3429 domain-containing protein [Chromatiaceae bacterium]